MEAECASRTPTIARDRGADPDEELRARFECEGGLGAVPFDPKPDGPRYAALGDAPVNVAHFIGLRLAEVAE